MMTFRVMVKPVCYFATLCFLTLGLQLPAARAALISTDKILNAQQVNEDRENLRSLLQRSDVRQALMERGVDPQQAQARVDSLTDREVHLLAGEIDELPAGSGALGLIVFVFLVLLFTDIMGFTDIFPFVKKPAKR